MEFKALIELSWGIDGGVEALLLTQGCGRCGANGVGFCKGLSRTHNEGEQKRQRWYVQQGRSLHERDDFRGKEWCWLCMLCIGVKTLHSRT